ncbi:MAG: thioredoxin domain-containing protein [Lachnospiraceae bacterium]|nr:thioredoxin domain-containing protein [Lachnospiraceae bacterium]
MNHLKNEKSPYLQQHKNNPIDWYPWGSEALTRARKEDKPIFLSIGYSTCHWCHVMARESFESEDVAKRLNESFISIKVDREERPDIDSLYMAACQAFTGSGGWPLTLLLLPDERPFFAGTYLPKNNTGGLLGLLPLLDAVKERWQEDRTPFLQTGQEVIKLLSQPEPDCKTDESLPDLVNRTAFLFSRMYDEENGGFGTAPKFPSPHNLLFLLTYSECCGKPHAAEMALHTLKQMYRGGIFDHIGGGFFRYATDENWRIPHFEKMLYDNALLAYTYLTAARFCPSPFLKTAAERTLDYVLRELTDPEGGFYCGQDADSNGEEGLYYLWTPEALRQMPKISPAEAESFCQWYGILPDNPLPNLLSHDHYQTDPAEIIRLREAARHFRHTRAPLLTDDKILAGWNGLMIAAFSLGYLVLEKTAYRKAAERAVLFLARRLLLSDGKLMRRFREQETAVNGQLEDLAFLAWGFLNLYSVTWDTGYLKQAATLADQLLNDFSDGTQGGFYLTGPENEPLIQRPKDDYDGALPSGNSMAAFLFARLFSLTGNVRYQEASRRQNQYLAGRAAAYPAGFSFAMLTFLETLFPPAELICSYAKASDANELLPFLRKLPQAVRLSVLVKTSANEVRLAALAPFTASYPIPENGACYYLCRNRTCHAPVYSLEALEKLLLASEVRA